MFAELVADPLRYGIFHGIKCFGQVARLALEQLRNEYVSVFVNNNSKATQNKRSSTH